MNEDVMASIKNICRECGNDPARMMDVALAVQKRYGSIGDDAMDTIAETLGVHRVEVASLVTFYSFLKEKPSGKIIIRLCNSIIDRMHGMDRVAEVFQQELGIKMGGGAADGKISLE